MYFETLQERLLDHINWRVRNGELTERRLAGLIGVSQPHTHNVLKGIRTLSPGIADRILNVLEMSVLDLVTAEDIAVRGTPRSRRPELKGSGATGPLPGKSREPGAQSGPN